MPGDPLEGFYYTHFFVNTIKDMEISASLDTRFWHKAFLGPGQNVAAVRHAIMALGASHWQFTNQDDSRPSDMDPFTLRHYNEAISDLLPGRNYEKGQAMDLNTTLTCCILFILIESLRGNTCEAIRHIRSGTELIANHKSSTYLPNNEIAELAAMFHAISCQVGLFSEVRMFTDITRYLPPKRKPAMPVANIRDLEDAEDVMNSFDDVVNHISWDLDGDWDNQDSECSKQWESLQQQLQQWDRQFTAIVKDLKDANKFWQNLERITNLRVQHKLWDVLLGDQSLDAEACSLLLDDIDRLWNNSPGPVYGLKTDLTTALFQLYVFCADEAIRLRIIALLRSRRRREILWDSLKLAEFLETDMARRRCGLQTEKWPDIGPSPQSEALIVFRI